STRFGRASWLRRCMRCHAAWRVRRGPRRSVGDGDRAVLLDDRVRRDVDLAGQGDRGERWAGLAIGVPGPDVVAEAFGENPAVGSVAVGANLVYRLGAVEAALGEVGQRGAGD